MSDRSQPIERAVLDSLTRGERERFALVPHRAGAVKVALRASLQSKAAVAEVRRLLQLIVALDTTLQSPTAAEGLREIVRADPDAVALIQAQLGSADGLSAVRRFAAQQGQVHALSAPMIDDARPANSLKISDFLDPAAGPGPHKVRTPALPTAEPPPAATVRRRGFLEE